MSAEVKKIIGEMISNKRYELELTQLELAHKCGLSRSYIGDIEAGRYMPSVRSLISIASALRLDLSFLSVMTEIQ
jgi:transcriptional regulator with XRE-family HTH domain